MAEKWDGISPRIDGMLNVLFEDKSLSQPCAYCYAVHLIWNDPESWPFECMRCGALNHIDEAQRKLEAYLKWLQSLVPEETKIERLTRRIEELERVLVHHACEHCNGTGVQGV